MHLLRTRTLFFLAFIACALVVGAVVYLQNAFNLQPCVLCVWQRWLVLACGLLCLAAGVHSPGKKGTRRYCLLILLLMLVGIAVSGGQVWLQTATADELVPILARLEHLFDLLSVGHLNDRLHSDTVLCAEINWSLFGISLPEWSLLFLTGHTLPVAYLLFTSYGRLIAAEKSAGD